MTKPDDPDKSAKKALRTLARFHRAADRRQLQRGSLGDPPEPLGPVDMARTSDNGDNGCEPGPAMSDVVDLNQKRLEKVTKDAATGEDTTTAEVVQLLACSNCASSTFRLAHDKTVLCAKCCIRIGPLRWFDVNQPEPVA